MIISSDFFLDANKVLCYQRAEDVRARACVPAACRESVLRAVHGDSILAGHPGIDHTYAAVAYAYYWPNLAAVVAHFVRSCAVCAASKSFNQLCMGINTFLAIPLQPFTCWAIDLVGPLPPTKKGHTWIVTWVDRTSKMIVAAAAADGQMTSEKLALMTFKEICCRFGLPLNLTMDIDVKFVSSLWQSLWQLCGTKPRFTSSYNPQSNLVERANRQVLEALRAAVATVVQYDEWDEVLAHITFGLNSHVSSATKLSPFEFAREFKAWVPLMLGPQRIQLQQTCLVTRRRCRWHNAFPTDTTRPQIRWQQPKFAWGTSSNDARHHQQWLWETRCDWTQNTLPLTFRINSQLAGLAHLR